MRLEDMRRSENVEDRRGLTVGRTGAGIGIGTVVLVIAGYFLGVDPRLIMGLMGGGDGTTQAEPEIEAGAPSDEAGQFVSHVLGDTEQAENIRSPI